MPFPYKTVLITGASAGIGRALAERMVNAGIFVIAVGRRRDRLEELVARFGADKIAAEPFDVADIEAIGAWAKRITTTYPTLDCVFLNAARQHSLNFTRPEDIDLATVDAELRLNYKSPLHTLAGFLPHLIAHAERPAAVVIVTSGLAVVPIPRCPGYCATKAALHSLAWTMRAQMGASRRTRHVRVVEILPPAVQTELHSVQPDLVAAGSGDFGVPLDEYVDETWGALRDPEGGDEILAEMQHGKLRRVDDEKRASFKRMLEGWGDSAWPGARSID